MIFFEVNGTGYAVDATELAGVASGCPFVSYPGLPAGIQAMIQWSGKVFPVVGAVGSTPIDLKACTFLFTLDNLKSPVKELALAVPGTVRVFFAESVLPPPVDCEPFIVGQVVDSEGRQALQIRVSRIAEGVIRSLGLQAAGRRGGRKLAA